MLPEGLRFQWVNFYRNDGKKQVENERPQSSWIDKAYVFSENCGSYCQLTSTFVRFGLLWLFSFRTVFLQGNEYLETLSNMTKKLIILKILKKKTVYYRILLGSGLLEQM